MKDFLKEDTKCRRELVLKHFEVEKGEWVMHKHRCCDICSKECKCNEDTCEEEKVLCEAVVSNEAEEMETSTVIHQRDVTQEHKDQISQRLDAYREASLQVDDESDDNHLYSGKDIASGIPRKTLDNIVRECNLELNFEQFYSRYKLFNRIHARNIWDIVDDVVGECNRLQSHSESEQTSGEVPTCILSRAMDVDPYMDDHVENSDEELTLQAVIHSSSDSESD
jgi:hypothetical protein